MPIHPRFDEYEDIIKDCDKIRIINFLKTIFTGDAKGNKKFGGTESSSAEGITILGSVTLPTTDGHTKPILCCAKQMDGILTERSSRRKQFDIAVKVLKHNFVNPYMGNGPIQGSFTQGLFFFFDEPGNFRLSLVTAEISAGKMELNNYRRQSFFVEAGKRNNTFRTRLCKTFSTFDELKSAFDVEKLSDDFFREYKAFYEDIVQYITGKRIVKKDSKKYTNEPMCEPCHEIFDQFIKVYGEGDNAERAVRNYVKKMMGRLVFIQFLQKKGWLGISTSQKDWHGGDTDFLQNLFTKVSPDDRENFVDNILEEIFFEAFNTKEQERKIKNETLKQYKFPFLNCGLFDRDIDDRFQCTLPSVVFSNAKYNVTERKAPDFKNWTKKRKPYFNSEACGLFDFFDRFNFTIDENDPTDAEVSVDPEMLSKIFENLLEDNKDKGAFYTPKEIVNYMVNESLIAYLETETSKVFKPATMNKIRDFVLAQDTESFDNSEKAILEEKLAEVKICDPAIGSGAFPMGLLNLLCKCRIALKPTEEHENRNTISAFKRDIIQQNIYGVDIEKGAVDIARLRFWLSLVVDEESPEILPNLEFKIMQGNSLLESYKGIDLSGLAGEKYKRTTAISKDQTSLVFNKEQAMKQIQKDLNRFYTTESHTEKENLTHAINDGVKNYIKIIAQQMNKEIEAMPLPNDKFFLWHTYFRDVFDRKGKSGFDIVIGNPPYFVYEGFHKGELDEIKKDPNLAIAYGGKLNAYKLFFAKALNVLACKNGKICFIFQNSFMADKQAYLLRKHIFDKKQLLKVDSFPERDSVKKRVFESVKMSVCIVLVNNAESHNAFQVNFWDDRYKSSGTLTTFTDSDIRCIDKELLSIPRIPITSKPLVLKIKSLQNAFFVTCNQGELNMTTHRPYFTQDNTMPKVFKGAAIQRYYTTDDMSQGIVEYVNEKKYMKDFPKSEKALHHTYERIAMQGMSGANDKIRLISTLIPSGFYLAHSCNYIIPSNNYDLKWLLGILNSKLANWFFKCFSTNSNVNSYEIEAIPFPLTPKAQQKPIIDLVDSILTAKKKNPTANTSEQEKEIDKRVYDLYGLTKPEINIIKGQDSSPSAQNGQNKHTLRQIQDTDSVSSKSAFLQGENL